MHQPIYASAQALSAIVPAEPGRLAAQTTSQASQQELDSQTPNSQAPSSQAPNSLTPNSQNSDGPLQEPQRYSQLQHQTLQQGQDLSNSLHQHNQLLDRLGEQSLSSWYRCRESASFTRQQAFAAVDRATTVDSEIAQLNRTIQQQLQQFDAQLQISTQTLRQEVAQKVGQYRRHVQQQSQQCRDRLRLAHIDPTAPAVSRPSPAQKLFQATTLR